MHYAEARREARRLLGPSAEVNFMSGAPALKYQVGVRVKGILKLMGAGNSWVEAIPDVKKRLVSGPVEGI